jgi:DNA replication protein DnaC
MTPAPMDLSQQLRALGLFQTAGELDDLIATATKKRWTPLQLLEHVAQIEHAERARRSLDRRTTRSRVGRFKAMADYDWAWPKKIDRDAVESVLRLDFIAEARNVVLVAPQGLGKTMIAQNIAHEAIRAGHGVLFITAAQLLLDLAAQDSARALDRRLKHYARVGVLIVDEIGYLSYDNRNADLLYQCLSLRHEKKSIVLTTNLAFSDWSSIFPSATSATALVDRVIHHADVIAIEGDSYRLREAKLPKSQRPKAKP